MAFKDRLKEARLNRGMTQEQVAEKIGVAKSTFTGYEKGNSEPNMLTISKIMKVLDVDANFLWQDDVDFPINVTYTEMNHIKKYRRLPDRDRELVDQHMERALEVQEENQQLKEELAIREEPTEPPAPEYDHLTVIAAHNDNAADPEQLELMRQDVERAKKLIAERKKK